jgi:acetyl esterase/lipase
LAPETKLPEIISDIEEAFRWLAGDGAKRFHLDPRRIVVTGESAGGYLTLVTGYRVRPKPKALVALYGYGDLIGDWSSKPNPYPGYNLRKISREEAESQTDGTVISDSDKRKGDGGLIYLYYRQNGLWPEEVSGIARSTIADKATLWMPITKAGRFDSDQSVRISLRSLLALPAGWARPQAGGSNDHPEKPNDGQCAACGRSWTVLCHCQ